MVGISGALAGAETIVQAGKGAKQVAIKARELGYEFTGYDIVGLFSRIAMIYVIASVIFLWIKATTGFAEALRNFLSLFGITIPGPPDFLVKFVNEGIVVHDPASPFNVPGGPTPGAGGEFTPPTVITPPIRIPTEEERTRTEQSDTGLPFWETQKTHVDYWEVVNVIVLVALVAEGYLYYAGAKKRGQPNPLVLGFFLVAGMGIALVGFAKHIGMLKKLIEDQQLAKWT